MKELKFIAFGVGISGIITGLWSGEFSAAIWATAYTLSVTLWNLPT